jgi:UDP-GlcNAc:undecaprenyl-phosphate GlcNAc-1-phosphate transferase
MLIVWLSTAFVVALILSSVFTPLVIRLASALGLYDSPDGGRHVHASPVPRLGGVAVFTAAVGAAVPVLLLGEPVLAEFTWEELRFLGATLLGAAILFCVGVVDDIRGLRPLSKFIAQFSAAGIAVYGGAELTSVTLGYGLGVETGVLAIPLVFLWIVGVTNAYNFIDGLNGLAAGLGVTALATLAVTGAHLGNLVSLLPLLALAGAVLGFLRYNFPTARIFLGDSGSLTIGFIVSVLALRAAQTPQGSTVIIIPTLALFLPLLDTLLALLRRWLRHAPLTGADARHIHHRLLALGFTARKTTVVLWGLAGFFGMLGLVIAFTAPFVATSLAILAIALVTILVIYGTNLLSYHEFTVAGEVLLTAPSRFRRSISDQIVAHDARARIENAASDEEISAVLAATAMRFGFLHIALMTAGSSEEGYTPGPDEWVWKMEYPLRLPPSEGAQRRALAIWCRAEVNMRPYGAERAARIIAPALEKRLVAGPPAATKPIRLADTRATLAPPEPVMAGFPFAAEGKTAAERHRANR